MGAIQNAMTLIFGVSALFLGLNSFTGNTVFLDTVFGGEQITNSGLHVNNYVGVPHHWRVIAVSHLCFFLLNLYRIFLTNRRDQSAAETAKVISNLNLLFFSLYIGEYIVSPAMHTGVYNGIFWFIMLVGVLGNVSANF